MGNVRVCKKSAGDTQNQRARGAHDIRSVIVPLGSCINQDIQLSVHWLVILDVMKGRCSPATRHYRMVGHLLSAVECTSLLESSIQLSFVRSLLDLAHQGMVCNRRDMVGLADHGNLKFILDHASEFNGWFQQLKIGLIESEKRDAARNLACEGINGRLGGLFCKSSEFLVDIGCELYVIDIV